MYTVLPPKLRFGWTTARARARHVAARYMPSSRRLKRSSLLAITPLMKAVDTKLPEALYEIPQYTAVVPHSDPRRGHPIVAEVNSRGQFGRQKFEGPDSPASLSFEVHHVSAFGSLHTDAGRKEMSGRLLSVSPACRTHFLRPTLYHLGIPRDGRVAREESLRSRSGATSVTEPLPGCAVDLQQPNPPPALP